MNKFREIFEMSNWEDRAVKNTKSYFQDMGLSVSVKLVKGKFIEISSNSDKDIKSAIKLLDQDDVKGVGKLNSGDGMSGVLCNISKDRSYWEGVADM